MDLNQFRKVKADKASTTLKHIKDGHEIKLAHGSLKPDMKSQLEKLPFHKYAEGTPDAPVSQDDGADQPIKINPQATIPESLSGVQTHEPDFKMVDKSKEIPDLYGVSKEDWAKQLDSKNATPVQQQGSVDGSLLGQQNQVQQQPDIMGMDAYNKSAQNALQEQAAGQMMMAGVQGKLGQQESHAIDESKKEQQAKFQDYKKAHDELTAERANIKNEIDQGHIDPDKYLKNMSTGGHIATTLGLLLGGMGSGLTGGPNLANQALQNSIDRDVNAQKVELGKKENLLSHNLQETGNLNSAMQLTRIQTNDMLSTRLKQLAAGSQNEAAKAQMLSIAGNFDMQTAKLQHDYAIQKSSFGAGSSDDPAKILFARKQAGMIDPKQYEEGNKEIKEAQEMIKLKNDMVGSFNDLSKKVAGGSLSPEDRKSAVDAFAGRLGKAFEGRYNEEAAKKQVGAILPAKFGLESKETLNNKMMRLNQLFDASINTPTLDGMGINVRNSRALQQPTQNQYEGKTGTLNGQRVVNRNGKWVPLGK